MDVRDQCNAARVSLWGHAEGRVQPACCGRRGGGCRHGGNAASPSARRAHRAGRGERDRLLPPRADRTSGGLSRPTADPGAGRAGAERRHPGVAGAPAAAAVAARRGRYGGRPRPAPDSPSCSSSSTCHWMRFGTSAPSTTGSRHRTGARGWATSAKAAGIGAVVRRRRRGARRRAVAALRAGAGGSRRRSASSRSGAVMLYASPLVIDPLFNRFDELPDGKLRADVLEPGRARRRGRGRRVPG